MRRVTTTPKTCTCVAKLQVDDCNFAHYLAGSPTAVDGEPMPEDQMRHLLSMTDKLNEKLKVLVSGHKKDDNATAIATMLAFNIPGEGGCPSQPQMRVSSGVRATRPLCTPDVHRSRSRSATSRTAHARRRCGRHCGAVVTAVQPSAALSVVPPEELQWVQCEDCDKWRKLAPGASAWDGGEFKCTQ